MILFPLPELTDKITPIKRRVLLPTDTAMFKGQQLHAYESLYNFRNSEEQQQILLSGSAGTGKTTVISKFLEDLLLKYPNTKVACTAPTNKAVKVMFRMAEYYHPNITYATLHSLLGLKEKIGSQGELIFVPDPKNPADLSNIDFLIIDEVSMLHESLFNYLKTHVEDGLRIIYVGDKYQIPPVNQKNTLAPPFNEDTRLAFGIELIEMTEIVRQASGNPIISLCNVVRQRMGQSARFKPKTEYVFDEDKGIFPIATGDSQYMENFMKHIFTSANFKSEPDFGKVICWRNATINKINLRIRNIIYNTTELNRVEVGEKLIANTPIFIPDDSAVTGFIILPTNEEFEVVGYTNQIEKINGSVDIPYHDTFIKYYKFDNTEVIKQVKILTYEGLVLYNKILDKAAAYANSMERGSFQFYRAWDDFWEFKKLFADINYNYACSGHKSQGSTYDNVLVIESDMRVNHKLKERNRIIYTSFSRPRHRLYIY